MKLDNDLLRAILLKMEASPTPEWESHEFDVEGYSDDALFYHFMLLHQAGFITTRDAMASDAPSYKHYWPVSITYKGQQFLEDTRNDTAWGKTKEAVLKTTGSASTSIMQALAKGFTEALIKQATGQV